MPRVRIGAARKKRHKRLLERAKGFVGGRSKLYKTAHETLLRAGNHRFQIIRGGTVVAEGSVVIQ